MQAAPYGQRQDMPDLCSILKLSKKKQRKKEKVIGEVFQNRQYQNCLYDKGGIPSETKMSLLLAMRQPGQGKAETLDMILDP